MNEIPAKCNGMKMNPRQKQIAEAMWKLRIKAKLAYTGNELRAELLRLSLLTDEEIIYEATAT
jgi:hypothetical protein